jgi:putative sigma-54 modulation protein
VRTVVRGKNIEVPDRVRRYAERKLVRIDRLLDDRSDALLELSVEQHRSAADSHIAEVTLVIDGQTLRGHAAAATHEAAIDEVTDKVERRAVDHKEKPRRVRGGEARQETRAAASGASGGSPASAPGAAGASGQNGAAPSDAEASDQPRIVKMKRFAIEPMFDEDAVSAMEELGHSFFIFVNAETERINVLYRRDDGDYGVIEPMVGGQYHPGSPSNGRGSGKQPTPAAAPRRQ